MSTEAADEITDVQYDLSAGTVTDLPSVIISKANIRNDSSVPVQQSLTYSYEKWAVGTWNNIDGNNPGTTQTFVAGVPFVNPDFKISVSAPSVHEFGRDEGIRETVTNSISISVPPHASGIVTVIIRRANIEVPFTYKQGGNPKNGIYKNVDSWKSDVTFEWN